MGGPAACLHAGAAGGLLAGPGRALAAMPVGAPPGCMTYPVIMCWQDALLLLASEDLLFAELAVRGGLQAVRANRRVAACPIACCWRH